MQRTRAVTGNYRAFLTMKIKIAIKHYLTEAVLFEFEKENNTQRDTILEAIKNSVDLSYADLSSANLRYVESYADLRYAKNISGDYTDFWWHIHHQKFYEYLNEPVRARINYIKNFKPKDEIDLRLKLLKPVLGEIPSTEAGWKKLHKIECGCGFDFKKQTIFSKKNGVIK